MAKTQAKGWIALTGEIWFIWQYMRLTLLLPVTVTSSGCLVFSWRGWRARGTALFWLAMVMYSSVASTAMVAQQVERRPTMWELAPRISLYALSALLLVVPATLPHYAPAVCAFTTSWRRVEVLHAAVIGSRLELGLEPLVYVSVALKCCALLLVVATYELLELAPWQLFWVVSLVSCTTSLCHVWCASYLAIASLAWRVARRQPGDCDRLGARGVRAYRLLWLHIEQVPYLLAVFAVATIYFFTFLNNIVGGWYTERRQADTWFTTRNVATVILFSLTGGAIFVMCMTAQLARDAVYDIARKQLLKMPLSNRGARYRSEVCAFLMDIHCRKSTIMLNGFIDIGRSRLVTMAATAMTYVMVLSQLAVQPDLK